MKFSYCETVSDKPITNLKLQFHALRYLIRVVSERNFRPVFGKFMFIISSWTRMVLTGEAASFVMSKQVEIARQVHYSLQSYHLFLILSYWKWQTTNN